MPDKTGSSLPDLLSRNQDRILKAWIAAQSEVGVLRADLMREAELRRQSRAFLAQLTEATRHGMTFDIDSEAWQGVRDMLIEVTNYRVDHGFTPSETATFILALKQPIFEVLRDAYKDDPRVLVEEAWAATVLLDRLGLFTNEIYIRGRDEIIQRQQQEMLELSTPVVKLWDRIVALPLIGTLDSSRAQIVMENLLEAVVQSSAEIVIIDITGVPTVDTLVAQHLLKTAAAAKLMGAECIISGIRPQIAQTIVHLGVDLGTVVTKATLADAFTIALRRLGLTVGKSAPQKRRTDGESSAAPAERTED
jgi:rsbT co-antagonist protein RsbR